MINSFGNEMTYPLDSYPPFIRETISAIQRDVQAPIELIGSAVMAAVSLACQGLIKIRYQDGRITPCSTYYIVIAPSGERKTAVYSLVTKPFYDFEKEARKKHEQLMYDFNAEQQSWKVQEQAILKCIRKGTEKGINIECENQRLKKHYRIQPIAPALPKLIYNDATPEALQLGLYNNISSASLMSDEAGIFFRGRAKNNLSFLNQLWDGSPFDVERKSGSFSVDGSQFTILLMIQPREFSYYIKRQGEHAVDSGFLARFMLTSVTSTQGQRSGRTVYEAGGETLKRFHMRIKELLHLFEENQRSGMDRHECLTLSNHAQEALEKYISNIEKRILKDKDQNPVAEGVLSKVPDNIVRIAALFHYFCDKEGKEISAVNIDRAVHIAYYYYLQTLDSLSRHSGTPEGNANDLYEWLRKVKNKSGVTLINKMEVRRKGPFQLRNTLRLNAALLFLEQEEKITICRTRNNNGSISEIIEVF